MPEHSADQAFALALEHHRAGRLAEAERGYRAILQREPQHADSLHLLGVIALQTRNLASALELVQRAAALRPDAAACRNTLGQVLERLGREDEAAPLLRGGDRARSRLRRGVQQLGLPPRAPGSPGGRRGSLSQGHRSLPRVRRAAYEPRQPAQGLEASSTQRSPVTGALSSYVRICRRSTATLLLTLHYHPDYSPADLEREHRAWAERHVAPLAAVRRPHENAREPDRRLRIGYVSPDFREHPVARFVLPLFREHDRAAGRSLYLLRRDEAGPRHPLGPRPRGSMARRRDARDEQLADLVRADEIDILVDLAAHSGHNRLLTFARKPAPVQVTYLAYCSTTGVDAIDYRVTDRFLDPPEEPGALHRDLDIPAALLLVLFRAAAAAGARRRSAARARRHSVASTISPRSPTPRSTSGCACCGACRRPGSSSMRARRPIATACGGPCARQASRSRARLSWAANRSRITCRPIVEIDVALDPYPYGGGTTTCDALWMGVPVVSLAGRTAVSRAGSTLLSNVGLEHLVARSEEQYVELAAGLIRDAGGLAELRAPASA